MSVPRPRSPLRSAAIGVGLAACLAAGCATGGAPGPASPHAPPAPALATPAPPERASPSAVPVIAPPATAPVPTPAATPAPDAAAPAVPAGPFTLDLFQRRDFVSQSRDDLCVPASILMMANMIDPGRRPAPAPGQREINRLARRLSTDRLVGPGSEPEGWARALNRLGYGRYEVRELPTRREAIAAAARAIRATGRPVGLLMWHGAHAWVMSGFEATADPAQADGFRVTRVRVSDPWYPRAGSAWGRTKSPGTWIGMSELRAAYLPWRRPAVRYVEKDGRFVLVLPVAGTG